MKVTIFNRVGNLSLLDLSIKVILQFKVSNKETSFK